METTTKQVTPFTYQGVTITAIAKVVQHVEAYQIWSKESGWIDVIHSPEYLISLGAKEGEIKH